MDPLENKSLLEKKESDTIPEIDEFYLDDKSDRSIDLQESSGEKPLQSENNQLKFDTISFEAKEQSFITPTIFGNQSQEQDTKKKEKIEEREVNYSHQELYQEQITDESNLDKESQSMSVENESISRKYQLQDFISRARDFLSNINNDTQKIDKQNIRNNKLAQTSKGNSTLILTYQGFPVVSCKFLYLEKQEQWMDRKGKIQTSYKASLGIKDCHDPCVFGEFVNYQQKQTLKMKYMQVSILHYTREQDLKTITNKKFQEKFP